MEKKELDRILVVGGAGYIGSHMLLRLQDSGWPSDALAVFDNLSRGYRDACGDVRLWEGDLLDPDSVRRCLLEFRPDLVMHFGAFAYVGESVQAPDLYYSNNLMGSLNLLNAMSDLGIRRLVFSSTCATYGEPEVVPIPESHPQRPINPYGRTKLMVEQILMDYAHAYGLQAIGLRYFNAAGADPQGRARERHEPETHLIPLVLREAERLQAGGNPRETLLQVFGNDFSTDDGSCVRDYIHVQDLCDAHLKAAQQISRFPAGGRVEFFNLANGNGFSVFDVIETCRQVTGQPIEARVVSRRAGDPARLIGTAEKAKSVLGWEPSFGLEDMVRHAWGAKSY